MSPSGNRDSAIDRVLRGVGSAAPPAGMEGRILTRLASERVQMENGPAATSWLGLLRGRMPRVSGPVLGLASAGLVCTIVVIGSVSYSRRGHEAAVPVPVPVPVMSQGLGAASAARPAAPASAPVAAGPVSRGRSARRAAHGRARVPRHARKAPGVVVPVPSAAPQN